MVIKKATHSPFRMIKLLRSNKVLKARVAFTDSCRYDIGSDQSDINKLFGFSFLTWKIFKKKKISIFGKTMNIPWVRPMHHYNSFRFGWTYSPTKDVIEIYTYWYTNGVRNFKYITSVNIDDVVNYELIIENEHIIFKMESIDMESIDIVMNSHTIRSEFKFGYLLQPFFGGNQTAPHDVEIVFDLL